MVMVRRFLAFAMGQHLHSTANQPRKEFHVAWRNRQSKAVVFARANCSREPHDFQRAAFGILPNASVRFQCVFIKMPITAAWNPTLFF
jgi:hypothetical protein